METYRDHSFQKPVVFMYFWLNYCNENHIERIPIAVKDIDHVFNMAIEIIETDKLHLFLLSGGTRIDDNEYLRLRENCLPENCPPENCPLKNCPPENFHL